MIASTIMRLVLSLTIVLAATGNAQKFQEYPFPPKFPTPVPNLFSSDSSHYLPPESHTAIPYFPMKGYENLPYKYLPPSSKIPTAYPTPFPLMMSTSHRPQFEVEMERENERNKATSPRPQSQKPSNHTENADKSQQIDRRDDRALPKHNYRQPIDRIDLKFSPQNFVASTAKPLNYQTVMKKMIIPQMPQDTHRNDRVIDQVKANVASPFQAPNFFQTQIFGSTTEPAIPIIRLSNEMDLDGSFSYEALGADQTHFVQHSRMENMGSEKEEQVVEGSYSYVGDNGQTYTVNYIADANGFRASGDHLPVAPPTPEIIQRAVQYNLAEEAKRPLHLKSWQGEEKEYDRSDADKNYRPPSPPPRNLFTGRTPEAFSFGFSQGNNNQNNLAASASSQSTVIANLDFNQEQQKSKSNGPISPQVTFLASQGAHMPSLNVAQESLSRLLGSEKPPMPQIMNYEAGVKDADQQDNKGLWRWQYGLNSNDNVTPNKNAISRSSMSSDDVVINFNEMTPQQYTDIYNAQLTQNQINTTKTSENRAVYDNTETELTKHVYTEVHNNYPQQVNTIMKPRTDYHHNFHEQTIQPITYATSPSYNTNDGYVDSSNNYQNYYNEPHQVHNNDVLKINQPTLSSTESPVTFIPPSGEMFKEIYIMKHSQPISPDQVQSNQIQPKQIQPKQIQPKQMQLNQIQSKQEQDTHPIYRVNSDVTALGLDYEENYYEPRKVKKYNDRSAEVKPKAVNTNDENPKYPEAKSIEPVEITTLLQEAQYPLTTTTTELPYRTTLKNIQFSDFINYDDKKSDFQPMLNTYNEASTERPITTTEIVTSDMLTNNIFLKSLLTRSDSEKTQNKFTPVIKPENVIEEPKSQPHSKPNAEPKTDKHPKLIMLKPKTVHKNMLNLADIYSLFTVKNHFESSKTKAKASKQMNHNDQFHEKRYLYVPKEESHSNENIVHPQTTEYHPHDMHKEFHGVIKNYKVLQRNNAPKTEPHSEILKNPFQIHGSQSSLPPLGRAGPSVKAYLPPIYD